MSEIDHEAALRDAHKLIECSKWMVDHGFSPWEGTSIARALIDLHAQLAAERARVEALVKLVREVGSRAQTTELEHLYKWIPEQLTAIINAHAQRDEA